jgi:hypothetical protein
MVPHLWNTLGVALSLERVDKLSWRGRHAGTALERSFHLEKQGPGASPCCSAMPPTPHPHPIRFRKDRGRAGSAAAAGDAGPEWPRAFADPASSGRATFGVRRRRGIARESLVGPAGSAARRRRPARLGPGPSLRSRRLSHPPGPSATTRERGRLARGGLAAAIDLASRDCKAPRPGSLRDGRLGEGWAAGAAHPRASSSVPRVRTRTFRASSVGSTEGNEQGSRDYAQDHHQCPELDHGVRVAREPVDC